MKNTLLFLFTFVSTLCLSQQKIGWDWALNTSSIDGDVEVNDSYIDEDGNLYLLGSFESSVFELDGFTLKQAKRSLEQILICIDCYPSFTSDIFFTKIDSNGNVIWLKKIEGLQSQIGTEIHILEQDIYILGKTNGPLIQDQDTTYLNNDSSSNLYDKFTPFISHFDKEGTFIKHKILEGLTSFNPFFIDNSIYSVSSLHVPITYFYEPVFGSRIDTIEILGQDFYSKFSPKTKYSGITANIFLKLNLETFELENLKELGEPYLEDSLGTNTVTNTFLHEGNIYALLSSQNSAIMYDGLTLDSLAESHFVILDSNGTVQNLFPDNNSILKKVYENEILLGNNQADKTPNSFQEYKYTNANEEPLTSSRIDINNSNVDFYVNSVSLTEDNTFLVSAINNGNAYLNNKTFYTPNYTADVSSGGIDIIFLNENTPLRLNNSVSSSKKPLIMHLDNEGNYLDIIQIEGDSMNDRPLNIIQNKEYIYYLGYYQSENINLEPFNLENQNNDYPLHANHAFTGVSRKFNNIVISRIEFTETPLITNIDNEENISFSHVYPNPSSGIINITNKISYTQLRIMDINGNLIKTFDNPKEEIALDLTTGTYLIQLITPDSIHYEKLIID